MKKKKIAFILGIRPDLIRAVLIVRFLKKAKDIDVILIWSGQNYSDNLKGIFFREFNVRKPDIELNCKGSTDAEVVSKLTAQLYPVFNKIKPDAAIFLGDTNTAMGAIPAAQLNIPIIHIEGCWHSYDWRMPEEKIRTIIDHISDVIYTYEEEYKERGIAEGLNPKNIVVVRNPIVDILNEFYFRKKNKLQKKATETFFSTRNIKLKQYFLMTCHRRENVEIKKSFEVILNLISNIKNPVYFPASYRTQKIINERKIKTPKNLIVVDPVGYEELLILLTNSKAVITDSGTLNEEACILNIPCINVRKATERPQVYDVHASVKFDPDQPKKYTPELVLKKLEKITGTSWPNPFGDGKSSKRIAEDIIKRVRSNKLRGFLPENNHLPIERSFMEDGIKI
ncbi:MAG: UDP-N-acetylglucosamine 2-epimerase (non-hydrolyzing) [Candidatus Levybacteria bacterium CG_4_10_14_0_2_um_filter_36_16]|nr:MAG: UDP-N-acetylglucosamine 2-epimerase [Candidatus Levybacteria bacterium CG2_30_37_29]PIR79135.1 MAG: UDP-N-acetylglucosamine 2-epimerase (non-hydrolyzing) [Candidatus Levybacteria bacterium CG10_big_fil_rev_8_21_14_0_10_36_30]PIZ96789.1 MAG: UDP-N-acetylglucosamine 2-epimerase (non-hydrolyzing) [Candidatus Levybacteria bacterium CG_4_10_14_0_2_um_filter_36_16]